MISKLKQLPGKALQLLRNLQSKISPKLKTTLIVALSLASLLILAHTALVIFSGESLDKAAPKKVLADPVVASVMITNLEGNSGGTGVILYSSTSRSIVMTNAHVCGVVERGGMVSGPAGSFTVNAYAKSSEHDLCAIIVSGDLKVQTTIADKAPTAYRDEALVSGHPALLPNVITKGQYSGRKVIAIMTGVQPCTDEEKKKDFSCALFGVKPIIEQKEGTLITATIMAGSSGSGVYNKDMELTNLVFAGFDGLSYAFAVPYEYLRNFAAQVYAGQVYWTQPNQNPVADIAESEEGYSGHLKRIREICDTRANLNSRARDMCKLVKRSTLFVK